MVHAIAVSPDSAHVEVSRGHMIEIWDIHADERIGAPLMAHKGSIDSLCFSPDGITTASGSSDKTIRIWDTQTHREVIEPIVRYARSVSSVAYTPDGCLIISGSYDETIRLWNAYTGEPSASLIHTRNPIHLVAVSFDGRTIAGGCGDKTIKARQIVAFSPDDLRIVSTSGDGPVCMIWDATNGLAIGQFFTGHTSFTRSAAFSPDGRYIASSTSGGTILIWDTEIGTTYVDPLQSLDWRVTKVTFTLNGNYIVSATEGHESHNVKVWDVLDFGVRAKHADGEVVTHTQAHIVLAEDDISGATARHYFSCTCDMSGYSDLVRV